MSFVCRKGVHHGVTIKETWFADSVNAKKAEGVINANAICTLMVQVVLLTFWNNAKSE